MSMNIYICATGVVKTPNGKNKSLVEFFDCIQTPTKISYAIMYDNNPIQAYITYALSRSIPKLEPAHYNYEDTVRYTMTEDLIEGTYYTDVVDDGYSHVNELKDWISMQEDAGFEIKIGIH